MHSLKFLATIIMLVLFTRSAVAEDSAASSSPKDDPFTSPRTAWYRDAKFGMFIHWGLYSVPAGEYHGKPADALGEWIMHSARIPIAEYERFAGGFNPAKFNAKEWAAVAKDAGMKYVVITSKHHDGFCMWGTKVTPYNIVDATPFHRDPMRELSAACKEAGLKFCFYHSIMDWHHPELAGYWNADKDAAKDPNDPRVRRYIEGQLKPQLRELVTQYDPAILWFDGEWVPWWTEQDGRDLEAYLHGLKPDLIINNRVGKRQMTDGDYETPEQEIPAAALGKRLWETCMTLNDTWGYRKDDHHWKTSGDVIHKLCDIASKGGNFLLNVGPTAEGVIPPESVKILGETGQWVRPNSAAIYGTSFTTAPAQPWGRITRKGNTWYAIVFDWPKDGVLTVPAATDITSARLLHGDDLKVGPATPSGTTLYLPEKKPEEPATVIAIQFAAEPKAITAARNEPDGK